MDHHPPDTKRTKREEQLEEGSVIAPLDAGLNTCLHGGLRKLLLHSKSSPSILGQTLKRIRTQNQRAPQFSFP
jgi:hypothetical protein